MSDLTTAGYSVGRVADLSGVTIRTLHHYDEVGLLSPGGRSDAGYRLYDEADLERLQRILFYRELGFALKEIRPSWTIPVPTPSVTSAVSAGCSSRG